MLTADPVTGDRELVIVNACRGPLGGMRQGDVTADAIQVRRADLAIEWRRVGTTEGPVLTDAEIRDLVRRALQIERKRGVPMEIEMTVEARAVRVGRARPIGVRTARPEERTGS